MTKRIVLATVINACACSGGQQYSCGDAGPDFDALSYIENRESVMHDFGSRISPEVKSMFRESTINAFAKLGGPQAFWETVCADKGVTEVFFTLEQMCDNDMLDGYVIHTVFRSGQEYYHASWHSAGQSLPEFWYSPPIFRAPLAVKYENLTRNQIDHFLTAIDRRYGVFHMRSNEFNYYQWTPHPVYVLVEVSFGLRKNLLVLFNAEPAVFTSFYELEYFYDRIKLFNVYIGQSSEHAASRLALRARVLYTAEGWTYAALDSILQYWPPEMRPDLDSLLADVLTEKER